VLPMQSVRILIHPNLTATFENGPKEQRGEGERQPNTVLKGSESLPKE
jgi:hypothetical protein